MTKFVISVILLRFILPGVLLLALALRPFGISLVYLLLFLLLPHAPVPSNGRFAGTSASKMMVVVLVTSVVLLLVHVAWHVFLVALPPYGSALGDAPCHLLETIALNLGLVSYKNIDVVPAIIRILPEVIMSVVSIIMYPVLKKLCTNPSISYVPKPESKNQQYPFLTNAGKYISLLLIMVTSVVRPSASSGLYFLFFLGCGTWWACGRELERAYALVARIIAALMAVHILLLLAYQCTWILEMLPDSSPYSRYFGLTQIVKMDCNNTAEFRYVDTEWATFVYPIMILITYYILVLETRELLKPKLIKGIKSSTKFVNARRDTRVLHQDSTGSVIVPDEDTEDPDEPGLLDEVVLAIIGFFEVLIRSSYIATSITMMAWSIMYHSWLTFVLLIWANIVWLVHNQRGFMLKTSPLLVAYAILLLLSQYIYGMNLTEAELPATVKGINLSQIGFERPKDLPCIPLLIKSMFMIMFWVTLRQKKQEERQRRHSSALADMVAPLHLTVGTAATVLDEPEYGESILLKKFGEWLKKFCTKFWIYIVVIMLFIIGITGERMTIFRIVYMFLFLFFILLFQTSYKLWRKMLYPFWIVLIIYSMINLVLVYIYQFDNFAQMVEEHLKIPQSLQYDLGLEKFVTSQLFLRLFTPTLFLIITIIQVHYFHKEFLEFSKLKSRTSSLAPVGDGPSPSHLSTIKDDISQISSEEVITVEQPHKPSLGASEGTEPEGVRALELRRSVLRRIGAPSDRSLTDPLSTRTNTFRQWMRRLLDTCRDKYETLVDLIFLYLEIHLIKIIFVSLMFLCVFDVCALHVPIMIAISVALLMSSRQQNWCLVIVSIIINVFLMAKMIYQIKYIQHEIFDVNCTISSNITVHRNGAEWLGFVKATHGKSLATILKGYIGLIAIFTFQSVVTYRQQRFRESGSSSRSSYRAKTVFPGIDRQKADLDLIHCLKYLFNYGFYKFGIEITLICLIGVIGSRMDLYAVFYALWLFVLVASRRDRQACLWPFFTAFVAIMVPLQYVLAVGEVPDFCIQYPWSSPDHHNLRKWLYLPDAQNPPHATKLIFDYFLLLLCARQRRVFHLERRYGDVYPGGSNKENIGTDWETPSFINPVPDFLSFISSWLDIIKRFVFLGMLWVTLAIMFLTGTNRVNLFSMGYLIGSFIFLWQGTDFYLRPKSAILKWWSWLLRYNVGVIVVKVVLQIPGCLFIDTLQEEACWFVQLFGIGCIDKFSGGSVRKFFKMDIINQHQCAVPREDIGLAWDGVCFAFLLLQRRLFHSYYFYRIIDESKASAVLASRGAELIDEIRERQMQQQDEQEKKILEKIKIKMERIKANQKKLQVSLRAHHDAASVSSRAVYWKHEPKTHQQAVRSGDYYMFDEFDELEDVDAKDNELTSSDEDVPKEMGLGENVEQPSQHLQTVGVQEMVDILRPRRLTDVPNEQSEYLYPPEEDNMFDKIKQYLQFGWAFVDSFFISVTRYIKKYSRDYRYVSKVLFNEKKILKEKEGFGMGIRTGKDMIWQPAPAVSTQRHHNTTLDEQDDTMFRKDKPPIVHFLFGIWYAILAHTDIVCYIMVFVNQIQSATILSIPLPLMVFLWGTLTIPRPSKTFWITLIAYTEVIVLIKSMFQFEILPWNQKLIPTNTPFTAPRIIGVERKVNYALYDLLLLLVIFFHRAMLKSLGLWTTVVKDSEHEKEIGETNFTALIEPEQGPSHEQEADKTMLIQKCDDSCPKQLEIAEISDEFDQEENEKYQRYLRMALMRYCHPVKQFYQRMLDPTARVTADVYAYMFMCDFFNFLVVIFGFAAFGTHQGDGGVQAYLEENKVPIPFLVMLILQFALIIIDRALYLRKFILGKILFQIVLIIGVHIWMFFVLPFITERTFNTLLPPPMWYMIKCIYLLLSAYQIRCGYPTRILGNFLCKGYNFFNMIFFKAFMIVPFVFELRTLMDWIWTDTSMTFMDWLKMEDIFANVFLLKCSRYTEDEFPQERGVKKKVVSKYLMGGTVLAFIIALIWFPLVLFAFGNSVGVPNLPYDVTARIRIGPFLATYQMSAQSHNIEAFTESDYDTLSNVYMKDRTAQTFLSNYLYDDVGVVSLNSDSTSVWDISPPDLKRLQEEAQSNSTLLVKFTYVISHSTNSKDNPPTIEEEKEVKLKPFLEGTNKRNPQRDILYKMLAGETKEWLTVEHLFPKFLKIFNKGTAKPVHQLMVKVDDDEDNMYRHVQMKLMTLNGLKWWQVRESCTDLNYETFLDRLPKNNCEKLVLYTFNDKLFPETLNFISGSGIIGLYTTFVFLASRVLRNYFSGICFKIMFEDLPNVDRVLQMCLDIYLVREADEMALEEDLFAKLVFLYRSPETMIKWTRPREDANVDNLRGEEMAGRNPN